MCPLFVSIIFHQMIALNNYEKCFLFHLKSSFGFRDIQIFLFLSSPLFLPVNLCLRGWLKINLKVYDIFNYLNKMLIIHFVWYLVKEKRYDIETLSIDEYQITNIFIEKSCSKWAPKVSPRPLFNFGKWLRTAITCKKFLRYFERGLSKSLKKVNFSFLLTHFLLMDKVIKKKRGLELLISHSSGYKISSEKFLY